MENAPVALAGPPAAGTLERSPFKARSMGKLRSNLGETPKEQLSVEGLVVETGREKPPLPSAYTLRVKPDRRCVQLPIPGGHDRRRPHC